MLVLGRKAEERIVITVEPTAVPVEIVVAFLKYAHGEGKIGVEAPKHVAVNREEVQVAIERAVKRGGKSRY